MEYGNFTLGKYPVKGEASIVMIGNLQVLGICRMKCMSTSSNPCRQN